MQTERIHWIDITRGIAIIFVIYAHVLGNQGIRYLFYAFHMPLFFFISGVLFRKDDGFLTVVKKSAKSLIIPYFILAWFFYVWWVLSNGSSFFNPAIITQFWGIFYGNSNNGMLAFNDVLWFLPTLFVTRVMFAALTKISLKTGLLALTLLLFSIFGYALSVFGPDVKLPFGFETALSGIVFYGAGFLWYRGQSAKKMILGHKRLIFPAFLLIMILLATIDFHNFGRQIDMRLNNLNNYFFFYVDAFLGIFSWLSFALMLNRNVLLEAFGRYSLVLFAWHPFVFKYLNDYILNLITAVKTLIPAIYTIITVSVILFANSIYENLRKKIFFRPS